MKTSRIWIITIRYFYFIALFALYGCTDKINTRSDKIFVTDLADLYYAKYLETYPESAYFADIPLERHDDTTSNNLADIKVWEDFQDSLYIELKQIDELSLTEKKDRISYWLLKEGLESNKAMRVCKRRLWDVAHIGGWQEGWALVADFQPVGSEELRRQAFTRWKKVPVYIETEITNLRKGISLGYSMPKEIVRLVIDQLQVILDYSTEDSPYMSPAKRADDKEFYAEWEKLVTEKILPAILEYQNYLKNEYLAAAREDISILNHPNGSECYRSYIRNFTTTSKTGNEIFESGQNIVSANKTRVAELGKEIYGTNNFSEVIRQLNLDSSDYFSTSEEILKTDNSLMAKAKEVSREWFATLPSSEVIIKPFEAHEGGNASYRRATDSKPAYFKINLKNPGKQKKGLNERATYHETYPGHHLQTGIAKDIVGLHPLSKLAFIGSYVEGWARYSEQLAEEMGLYQSKSALIHRRAWPARGMVVDPGLHLKGWTKDQAIAYIMEAGRSKDTALSIYRRVIIWPAQLTSYDVGGEEIKSLRKLARQGLGDKFNIRIFHSKVLENGPIPLDALRSMIERWIKTETD